VCLLPLHTGCGCSGHPAFPTPSFFLGEKFMHDSGASRRGIVESYLEFHVIARSEATKQSILHLRSDGLLRFARNDGLAV
jgi:hypothetical protein